MRKPGQPRKPAPKKRGPGQAPADRRIPLPISGSVELAMANDMTRKPQFNPRFPPQKRPNRRKARAKALKMSLVASKYAAAIMNPWSAFSRDASIPIGNGRPSFKTMTVQRFDAAVGTAGIGWVAIAPGVANDIPTVYYTGSTYGGTSVVPFFTAASATLNGGVTAVNATTPYTASVLADPYQTPGRMGSTTVYGRVVSCGVTATYTGTTVNEGGLMYCFTDPDHNSIIGSTVATLGARLETDIANVSRWKCMLTDCSLTESEASYDRSADYDAVTGANASGLAPGKNPLNVVYAPFSGGFNAGPDAGGLSVFSSAARPAPTSVILFTGTAGNTVHFEVIQHLEYQGPGAEGRTTESSIDVVGFNNINAALGRSYASRNSVNGTSFSDSFMMALGEVMSDSTLSKSLSQLNLEL